MASVIDNARFLYKYFFANSSAVPWPQFKIKRWDVGFYQVRRSLEASDLAEDLIEKLSESVEALRKKLLPQVYNFGFLQGQESFFGSD